MKYRLRRLAGKVEDLIFDIYSDIEKAEIRNDVDRINRLESALERLEREKVTDEDAEKIEDELYES